MATESLITESLATKISKPRQTQHRLEPQTRQPASQPAKTPLKTAAKRREACETLK